MSSDKKEYGINGKMKTLEELSAKECIEIGHRVYKGAIDSPESVRQAAEIYMVLQALYKQNKEIIKYIKKNYEKEK